MSIVSIDENLSTPVRVYVKRCFVYWYRGKQLVLRACNKHKDMEKYDPLGGGLMYWNKTLVLHGSSNTYGPFPSAMIRRLRPQWIVHVPTTFSVEGKMSALKVMYPKARISVKWLQDGMQDGTQVKSQRFYTGKEKREYWNCKLLEEKESHCDVCLIVEQSAKRLGVEEDVSREIFIDVGATSCKSRPGLKKKYLLNEVLVMAKQWAFRTEVEQLLSIKHRLSVGMVTDMYPVLCLPSCTHRYSEFALVW